MQLDLKEPLESGALPAHLALRAPKASEDSPVKLERRARPARTERRAKEGSKEIGATAGHRA